MGFLQLFRPKPPQQDNTILIEVIQQQKEQIQQLNNRLQETMNRLFKVESLNHEMLQKIIENTSTHKQESNNKIRRKKTIKLRDPSPTQQVIINFLELQPHSRATIEEIAREIKKDIVIARAQISKMNIHTEYRIVRDGNHYKLINKAIGETQSIL